MSARSTYQLAERRRAIKGRLDAQRYAIGAAWSYFEKATATQEGRARRGIIWTRRIAGVAIIASALRALRRPTRPGVIGRTMGTVAVLQNLARLLRLTRWSPR